MSGFIESTLANIVTRFIAFIWGLIRKPFEGGRKSDAQIDIPKKTLRLIPTPGPLSMWWHMGSWAGKPAMQVVGDFKVTNITKYDIVICAAKMKKPKLLGRVTVTDRFDKIAPLGTTDLRFDFFVFPPFKKEEENFTADVAIVDQFGNEHWIKRIDFGYR